MNKYSYRGMSFNLVTMLTGAVLFSGAVSPAHAAKVDLNGEIKVVTPMCALTISSDNTAVNGTLEFDQTSVSNKGAGTFTPINSEAVYDVRLDGGTDCNFANVSIGMPFIQRGGGAGYQEWIPVIRTHGTDLPATPFLSRLEGYTTANNTGSAESISGAVHSVDSQAFLADGSNTFNINVGGTWSAGLQTSLLVNTNFGDYRQKPYYQTASTTLSESADTSVGTFNGWPRHTSSRYAGTVSVAERISGVAGQNYVNVPAASLSNFHSLKIGVGMLFGVQTYVAGVIDNSAVIDGDNFNGSGTLTVTMS